MSEPKRIQRKRTKGWRMPEGAVYVGRGTQWGNPYRVGDESAWDGDGMPVMFDPDEPLTADDVVALYRMWIKLADLDSLRGSLAGRDLVCWCPLEDAQGNRVPCHADVLLELANPGWTP